MCTTHGAVRDPLLVAVLQGSPQVLSQLGSVYVGVELCHRADHDHLQGTNTHHIKHNSLHSGVKRVTKHLCLTIFQSEATFTVETTADSCYYEEEVPVVVGRPAVYEAEGLFL